jgi:hypothetical protein
VIIDKLIISHQLKSFDNYDQTSMMYYSYNHILDSVMINKKNFCDTMFFNYENNNYYGITNKPIIGLYTKQMYVVKDKLWFIEVINN